MGDKCVLLNVVLNSVQRGRILHNLQRSRPIFPLPSGSLTVNDVSFAVYVSGG